MLGLVGSNLGILLIGRFSSLSPSVRSCISEDIYLQAADLAAGAGPAAAQDC